MVNRKMFYAALFAGLSLGVMAQQEPGQGAVPEAEVSTQQAISEEQDVMSMIKDCLVKDGKKYNNIEMQEGENIRKNGELFFISIGTGTIEAPRSHRQFAASRVAAYNKAMLAAKRNMVEHLKDAIQTETEHMYAEGSFSAPSSAEQPKPDDSSTLGKIHRLINAKLDKALRAEGIDPDKASKAALAKAAKNKLAPSKEELSPNMRFVENKFIAQLEANNDLNAFVVAQKKSWDNDEDFVKSLYEKIQQSDIYAEYMAAETTSYDDDREFWRKIYKNIIFNNAELDEVLEDQSLYWNDDKEIVDTFVLKTIKRFDPKNGAKQELLPEFKDEEDQDFARRLFRRAIMNAEYYRHLIGETSKNWDLNRVALMDVVIMQIALAEILSFPNIPVNVSLNEYVEIAKLYSTPKSGGFINGTLDAIVNKLKKENKLTK